MRGHVQSKLLLDDRHQDIDADGDQVRPHSVLGGAVEALDAQVLLDPPRRTVPPAIGTGTEAQMVGAGKANWLSR